MSTSMTLVADLEELKQHDILRSDTGTSYNTAETQLDDLMRTGPYERLRMAFSFLEDDDGRSFLDHTYDADAMYDEPDPDSINILPSSRTLYRTPTNMSTVSMDSVAPRFFRKTASKDIQDSVTLALARFCDVIARHDTLSAAEVLSVEAHAERTSVGVLHRFLIFHVRRPKRPDVWLRVDRRREGKSSLLRTAMAGGKTAANDTVQLSDSRLHLLRSSRVAPENVLKFNKPPNLGTFRKFLLVICEELKFYQVWPDNCWFLCSLLQEHLAKAGDGSFEVGKLMHPKLGNGIRGRINYRLAHTPEGIDAQATNSEDGVIPGMLISACNGACRFHRPVTARSFSVFSQDGIGSPCNDFGDYVGVATVIGENDRVSVQPCRIRKGFTPTCFVPYDKGVLQHRGQFSLLCITDDMEWVPASDGVIPDGRVPVEGGFEEMGEKLYHALDKTAPYYAGKTAPHIGGAEFVYGGHPLFFVKLTQYKILCWKAT